MSNIPYIVDNNKKFIKSIYMIFIYYLKIELENKSIYIENKISKKINEDLKRRNLIDILHFSIRSAYDSVYEITISDSNNQKWIFEVSYSNLKKIELVEVHKGATNFCISNTIKGTYLSINADKKITKAIDLKDCKLSKEEIDFLLLEYDITTSNDDIKNIVFKDPEILDFVWDYYGGKNEQHLFRKINIHK